jgi:hypothetical protein
MHAPREARHPDELSALEGVALTQIVIQPLRPPVIRRLAIVDQIAGFATGAVMKVLGRQHSSQKAAASWFVDHGSQFQPTSRSQVVHIEPNAPEI